MELNHKSIAHQPGKNNKTVAKFEDIQVSKSVIFNEWIESLMPHCLKDKDYSIAGTPWEDLKKEAM